jgi:prolipoprotein diacylglyceryltransferase
MFPIFHLGPLAIQVPGLFLLAGVWVATNLIEKEAGRKKLSATVMSNMILISLVAGILGARLWYAIRFLNVYIENPVSLFSLNPTTLATMEGALTGLLAGVIYAQRNKLALWPTLDTLTPGLAAMAVAFGFSHLASGDAFGEPTGIAWAIELWGEQRHPSQGYEIVAAGLIFLFLWRMRQDKSFPGFLFLSWVGMTAIAELFLEAFRGDSIIILETIRQGQVLSLMVLLGAMGAMYWRGRLQDQPIK